MLTIRLTRKGRKNQPFFRVVVIDKRRSSKGGRAVEELGYIDPLTKKKSLNKERLLHWIKMGAQPTATVKNLLISEKIIEGAKVKKFSVTKKAKAEAAKAADAAKAAAAAPAPEPTPEPAAEPAPEAPVETPTETPKEELKPEEPKVEETPVEEPKKEA